MPCMCGDTYCPSCGPAQGNYRCPACGQWADDGGCEDPERCAKINAENDTAEAAMWEEMFRAEEEFERLYAQGYYRE